MCGKRQVLLLLLLLLLFIYLFSNTLYFYCNLFCYLLTYLFTYLFLYFLLCINVVNLLSIKKNKLNKIHTPSFTTICEDREDLMVSNILHAIAGFNLLRFLCHLKLKKA